MYREKGGDDYGLGLQSGFKSAKLKLSRARMHFCDLQKVVCDYLSSSPFRLCIGYDDEKNNTIVSMKQVREIPEEIAVIVGDIFHNLRSSLDVAIYGIVAHKAKNRRKIQFPFTDSLDKLENRILECQLSESDERIIELIKDMKPYPSGNRFLYCVSEINNIDKHRMILPVATFVCISANELKGIHPAFSIFEGDGVLVNSSVEIFKIPLEGLDRNKRRWEKSFHGEFKKDHLFKLSFENLTAEVPDFIELTDECINEVSDVLWKIENLFVGEL